MELFFGYIGLIIILGFVSGILLTLVTPGCPDDTWSEEEKKTFHKVFQILWMILTIILFYCYGIGENSVLNNKEDLDGFASVTLILGFIVGIVIVVKTIAKLIEKLIDIIKKR